MENVADPGRQMESPPKTNTVPWNPVVLQKVFVSVLSVSLLRTLTLFVY